MQHIPSILLDHLTVPESDHDARRTSALAHLLADDERLAARICAIAGTECREKDGRLDYAAILMAALAARTCHLGPIVDGIVRFPSPPADLAAAIAEKPAEYRSPTLFLRDASSDALVVTIVSSERCETSFAFKSHGILTSTRDMLLDTTLPWSTSWWRDAGRALAGHRAVTWARMDMEREVVS